MNTHIVIKYINIVQMKVLLLTMFKVGSTTIANILHRHKIPFVKLHQYDNWAQKQDPIESFTHIITLVRDPVDLYISAMFQDISMPAYEYYYGEKWHVLRDPVTKLINHFDKIDWSKYRWLNFDYYAGIFLNKFRVDVYKDMVYDKEKGFGKVGKLLILDMNKLDDNIGTISGFLDNKIKVGSYYRHNDGEIKWYSNKYKEFREKFDYGKAKEKYKEVYESANHMFFFD